MCDGGAITVGLVMGALTAGTQAYAAHEQKKASDAALDYNRAVAEANAKSADDYARSIAQQGEWEKRRLALEYMQKEGQARTQYAAAGVALGSGTAADYMADIADAYDLDSRQLDYDIRSRVYQAKVQGANFRNEAGLYAVQRANTSRTMNGQMIAGLGSGLSTGLSAGFAAYGAFGGAGGGGGDLLSSGGGGGGPLTINYTPQMAARAGSLA